MKFPASSALAACGFVAVVVAAPSAQSAQSAQSGSVYPVGFSGSRNAKVAGRLFNVDGKVGYLAGKGRLPFEEAGR